MKIERAIEIIRNGEAAARARYPDPGDYDDTITEAWRMLHEAYPNTVQEWWDYLEDYFHVGGEWSLTDEAQETRTK